MANLTSGEQLANAGAGDHIPPDAELVRRTWALRGNCFAETVMLLVQYGLGMWVTLCVGRRCAGESGPDTTRCLYRRRPGGSRLDCRRGSQRRSLRRKHEQHRIDDDGDRRRHRDRRLRTDSPNATPLDRYSASVAAGHGGSGERPLIRIEVPAHRTTTPPSCGVRLSAGWRRPRDGNLGTIFDHVGIRVSDLGASERFYRTVLAVFGVEPSYADGELVMWEEWAMSPTDREHPAVTRGLHVGFRAPDRATVDAFWRAGIDAGYPDDGTPGPRSVYGPDYYGAFLLDPDGNSVEAVHGDRERAVPDGCIDHLWLRVRDPQASRRFYTTVAPYAGLRLAHDAPGRVQFRGEDYSFSLVCDERPLTEHLHLAFAADADATVRAFHAAALAAGYEDHGIPGERAVYHPGYYAAFVLDPDGHNIEVVNHNR